MSIELELNGPKNSIDSQQQNKNPQHDTKDPQKDPPEVISEYQDLSDYVWLKFRWPIFWEPNFWSSKFLDIKVSYHFSNFG